MDILYGLTFYPQKEHSFFIGLFRTAEEAKQVEDRYRREIPGFKDCPCEAKIAQIPVIGKNDTQGYVFRFMGWNVNKALEKIDLVESMCYTNPWMAHFNYRTTQTKYQRSNWAMNRLIIGYCQWQNGFPTRRK